MPPYVLQRSLEKAIIPTCNFLKSLLQTSERTIIVAWQIFSYGRYRDSEAQVLDKIKIPRESGVSKSSIASFLTINPSLLWTDRDRFTLAVEKVKQMGFNPHNNQFVRAIIL